MGSPANEVVQGLVLGESSMAALVGENPKTGSNTSLEEAIGSPGDNAQFQGGNELDVKRSIDQTGAVDDVPSQVEEGDRE